MESKASGGFVYQTDMFEEGEKPYGVMTFAGLDSLLLCHLEKNDPRVEAALDWISKNYSVTEHPGRGDESLYFYYASMAKP